MAELEVHGSRDAIEAAVRAQLAHELGLEEEHLIDAALDDNGADGGVGERCGGRRARAGGAAAGAVPPAGAEAGPPAPKGRPLVLASRTCDDFVSGAALSGAIRHDKRGV